MLREMNVSTGGIRLLTMKLNPHENIDGPPNGPLLLSI